MKLSGVEGGVKQGYFPVVTLGAWSFEGERDGGTFTAREARVTDAFRIHQPGLSVVVPFGQAGSLRWPILAMQITDGVLSATVGAREST